MITKSLGKIAVLIEEHFDSTEYRRFNEYFPTQGYEVEDISHLWGNESIRFGSNPENDTIEEHVIVTTEIEDVQPDDYQGIICIGAYAMDRLRYQVKVTKSQKNNAPAVVFLRQAIANQDVKLGAICHSLWLFCADPDLIQNRQVTCAHNIICDVENAGAEVIYDGDATKELVIDGNLITGKHPGMVNLFIVVFVQEMKKVNSLAIA